MPQRLRDKKSAEGFKARFGKYPSWYSPTPEKVDIILPGETPPDTLKGVPYSKYIDIKLKDFEKRQKVKKEQQKIEAEKPAEIERRQEFLGDITELRKAQVLMAKTGEEGDPEFILPEIDMPFYEKQISALKDSINVSTGRELKANPKEMQKFLNELSNGASRYQKEWFERLTAGKPELAPKATYIAKLMAHSFIRRALAEYKLTPKELGIELK